MPLPQAAPATRAVPAARRLLEQMEHALPEEREWTDEAERRRADRDELA